MTGDSPTTPHSPLPTHQLIFLVGYRGSGKTCVAKQLAERLGWQWLDADAVLVERAGRSIKVIFSEEGETGFRNREAALLEEFCQLRQHVIATGGGVILRQENRERLRKGYVVWLTAEPNTLWQRIAGDPNSAVQRPNLSSGGLPEVENILRSREPLYRDAADFEIDSEHRTPEMVAERILDQLVGLAVASREA